MVVPSRGARRVESLITMENATAAVSPSTSVAVSVYVVSACAAVGVPAMIPPVVVSAGRVYVSPAGGAGVRA